MSAPPLIPSGASPEGTIQDTTHLSGNSNIPVGHGDAAALNADTALPPSSSPFPTPSAVLPAAAALAAVGARSNTCSTALDGPNVVVAVDGAAAAPQPSGVDAAGTAENSTSQLVSPPPQQQPAPPSSSPSAATVFLPRRVKLIARKRDRSPPPPPSSSSSAEIGGALAPSSDSDSDNGDDGYARADGHRGGGGNTSHDADDHMLPPSSSSSSASTSRNSSRCSSSARGQHPNTAATIAHNAHNSSASRSRGGPPPPPLTTVPLPSSRLCTASLAQLLLGSSQSQSQSQQATSQGTLSPIDSIGIAAADPMRIHAAAVDGDSSDTAPAAVASSIAAFHEAIRSVLERLANGMSDLTVGDAAAPLPLPSSSLSSSAWEGAGAKVASSSSSSSSSTSSLLAMGRPPMRLLGRLSQWCDDATMVQLEGLVGTVDVLVEGYLHCRATRNATEGAAAAATTTSASPSSTDINTSSPPLYAPWASTAEDWMRGFVTVCTAIAVNQCLYRQYALESRVGAMLAAAAGDEKEGARKGSSSSSSSPLSGSPSFKALRSIVDGSGGDVDGLLPTAEAKKKEGGQHIHGEDGAIVGGGEGGIAALLPFLLASPSAVLHPHLFSNTVYGRLGGGGEWPDAAGSSSGSGGGRDDSAMKRRRGDWDAPFNNKGSGASSSPFASPPLHYGYNSVASVALLLEAALRSCESSLSASLSLSSPSASLWSDVYALSCFAIAFPYAFVASAADGACIAEGTAGGVAPPVAAGAGQYHPSPSPEVLRLVLLAATEGKGEMGDTALTASPPPPFPLLLATPLGIVHGKGFVERVRYLTHYYRHDGHHDCNSHHSPSSSSSSLGRCVAAHIYCGHYNLEARELGDNGASKRLGVVGAAWLLGAGSSGGSSGGGAPPPPAASSSNSQLTVIHMPRWVEATLSAPPHPSSLSLSPAAAAPQRTASGSISNVYALQRLHSHITDSVKVGLHIRGGGGGAGGGGSNVAHIRGNSGSSGGGRRGAVSGVSSVGGNIGCSSSVSHIRGGGGGRGGGSIAHIRGGGGGPSSSQQQHGNGSGNAPSRRSRNGNGGGGGDHYHYGRDGGGGGRGRGGDDWRSAASAASSESGGRRTTRHRRRSEDDADHYDYDDADYRYRRSSGGGDGGGGRDGSTGDYHYSGGGRGSARRR